MEVRVINDICDSYCSNKYFNETLCDEKNYVDCHMEARLLAVAYLVPVTILMLLILLMGVFGNVCVCVVITKHPTMRTITNHYLFSLAISDLLVLLFGLPQELWYYWHIYPDLFGSLMCKLRAFISETTTYASVLTVASFSIERYIAICHPFHSWAISGYKRALAVILCTWMISMACAVPLSSGHVVDSLVEYPPLMMSMTERTRLNEVLAIYRLLLNTRFSDYSKVCWLSNEAELHDYLAAMSVLFFFIPMGILAFAYTKIGFCIRSRSLAAENSVQGRINADRSDQDKTVIKVLAAVVITFFICWAPFHVQRLVNSEASGELKGPLFVFTGVFYYLSACVNPILYNVMSRRYRKAFKETFFGIDATAQEFSRKINHCQLPELSKTSSIQSNEKSSSSH